MREFDHELRDALSEEDREFLAKLNEEPGAVRQVVDVFQGPLRTLYVAFFVFALVVGLVGIYAVWRFALATEIRPLFYWGATLVFCMVALSVVRVVFFLQINTNRILRELKRLELQVAQLAAQSRRK
jgi:hypothetical protein